MTTIIFSKTEYAVGLSWLPPSTPSLRGTPHKKKRALLAFKPPPVGYTEIDTRDGIQTGMVYDQAPSRVGISSRGHREALINCCAYRTAARR